MHLFLSRASYKHDEFSFTYEQKKKCISIFYAPQIDASRAEESYIRVCILLFKASQKNAGCIHNRDKKLSDKINLLKALYKRVKAMEKKNSMKLEARKLHKADPTRMYFERWGLLAPPPGKAAFQKHRALLFL